MYLLPAQIDRFHDFVRSLNRELLLGGSVLLLVLAILYAVWEAIHRRRRRPVGRTPELAIDVSTLPAGGPPAAGPQIEFYNLPMRLAVIVVAPAGRVSRLPPLEEIHGVLDAIVPGLADVAVAQQSMLYYWPPQLSSRGFAHGFFRHVPLPGDGGKGTPWSAAAGGFKVGDQPFTAGLILTAASPNALGQVIVETDTKWLDVLRVKMTS
jgi:hypothetical protein